MLHNFFKIEQVSNGELQEYINLLFDKYKEQGHEIDIIISCRDKESVEIRSEIQQKEIFSDQCSLVEKTFPDGHRELCENEADYNNKLASFLTNSGEYADSIVLETETYYDM